MKLSRLNIILTKIKDAGIKLEREIWKFMKNQVKYLGYIICEQGLEPDPNKIERSPTQPFKERRAAAGELCIPHGSRSFSSFLTIFPSKHISFRCFYRIRKYTRTYCKNPSVKMNIIEVFMAFCKSLKLDLGYLLSSQISVSPIFKHSNLARVLKLSVCNWTTILYVSFPNL